MYCRETKKLCLFSAVRDRRYKGLRTSPVAAVSDRRSGGVRLPVYAARDNAADGPVSRALFTARSVTPWVSETGDMKQATLTLAPHSGALQLTRPPAATDG